MYHSGLYVATVSRVVFVKKQLCQINRRHSVPVNIKKANGILGFPNNTGGEDRRGLILTENCSVRFVKTSVPLCLPVMAQGQWVGQAISIQ